METQEAEVKLGANPHGNLEVRDRTCVLVVYLVVAAWAPALAAGQSVFEPPARAERLQLRAQPVASRMQIDGRLTEMDWASAAVATDFRQIEPHQGEPATHPSHVRVLYDAEYLYIGAVLHDPRGSDGVRVSELRRDFDTDQSDLFGVHFDTFLDGRNAIGFLTNPFGVQRDLQSFDDQGRLTDLNWDAPWRVATQVTDSSWVAEFAIPWTTLRYPPDATEFGINFIRTVKHANETSGWSPWPRGYTVLRMSYAGRLAGLQPPPPGTNLRVQPYSIVRRDQIEQTGIPARTDTEPQLGADVKWAITPTSVLDLTVNTDFAQADADIQQINLNRFSVFFPERRQFFLESASLYTLGLGSWGEPFFSRRIGLDGEGAAVPIDGGVRFTQRNTTRNLGLLAIRQRAAGDEPASSFFVARAVQNLGTQHRVGGMLVGRYDGTRLGQRSNQVAVLDGFVRPTASSYVRAALARSFTSGEGGDGNGAWLHAASQSNRGYFGWIQAYYGEQYNPESGFLPRGDLILTSPAVTLDLRPSWKPSWVRLFNPGFSSAFYHRASDSQFQEGDIYIYPVTTTFQNSAYFRPFIHPQWQRLESDFSPVPGLTIPAGAYNFTDFGFTFRDDLSRKLWWWVTAGTGAYFDGRKSHLIYRMRVAPSPRASLTIDYVGNRITDVGPQDVDVTTHLWYPELRLALNPRLQLSTLYQYNSTSRSSAWNARLSWEFRPLSYVYLVFNSRDYREPTGGWVGDPLPTESRLIAKATYLFQW